MCPKVRPIIADRVSAGGPSPIYTKVRAHETQEISQAVLFLVAKTGNSHELPVVQKTRDNDVPDFGFKSGDLESLPKIAQRVFDARF